MKIDFQRNYHLILYKKISYLFLFQIYLIYDLFHLFLFFFSKQFHSKNLIQNFDSNISISVPVAVQKDTTRRF
jgi:hypothetical protein